MAARKKTTTRNKPHYVRAKKRKGADSGVMFQRTFVVILGVVILISLLVGVGLGFNWIGRKLFSENPRFELQNLVISCDGKLTEDFIRETAGIREGTNLWAFAFADIEQRLYSVSRVETVSLERRLPNTLLIHVKERVAVARIIGIEEMRFPFLIDRYGYILPYRRSASNLPLIKGIDKELRLGEALSHPDIPVLLEIISLCESTGYLRDYVRLESLDVKYADFIDMRLQGGIRARMPRYKPRPKLQKLASVIKISIDQGQRVKEVDLTLDSAKVPVTYY